MARAEQQLPLSTVCLVHGSPLFDVAADERFAAWGPDILTPALPGEAWPTIERLAGGRAREVSRRNGAVTPNVVRMNAPFGDREGAAAAAHELGYPGGAAHVREAFFAILFLLTRYQADGRAVVGDIFHPTRREHRIFYHPFATSLEDFGISHDDPNAALDIVGALLCRNPDIFQYPLSRASDESRSHFINRYRKDLPELLTEPLLLLASLFDEYVGQFYERWIEDCFPGFAQDWIEAARRYQNAK